MRKSLSYLNICILSFFILLACKKTEDVKKYFPGDITGDWYNKSDASHIFSFKVTTSPARIATTYLFEGTERSSNSTTAKLFNGNYNEREIAWEYIINGVSSGRIYLGTVNGTATLMTLKKPELDTIILIKK